MYIEGKPYHENVMVFVPAAAAAAAAGPVNVNVNASGPYQRQGPRAASSPMLGPADGVAFADAVRARRKPGDLEKF